VAHSTIQMKQSLLHAEDKHIHRHRVLSTYQHLQKIHSIHQIKTSHGFFCGCLILQVNVNVTWNTQMSHK